MPMGATVDHSGYRSNVVVGHGLNGMHERATLYGGRIDAGPRSGGGFAVHAVIPYPRAP
jgi:signal transduction histidine kinase